MPRTRERLAPPLTKARASSKRGAHRRNQKQRKHNGAEATILYWAPLDSLPPPQSSLLSKGVQVMKLTTQLGPSDQTIACRRGIRSSCDRITVEKRRCKWIVLQTRPHLNKENAYGGGNRRRRESAFTSGPSFPLPGPPPSRLPARRREDRKKALPQFRSSARSGVASRECLSGILF